MKVLIVGAGKTGTAAAAATAGKHTVTVLEVRPEHVEEARHALPDVDVVHGSGTDSRSLEASGVHLCDAVVITTGSDEVNLVASTIAKFGFRVPLVLARVVDHRSAWLFNSEMGVDVAIDETGLAAGAVTDALAAG
jgi:trk system potassium uptake protein